MSASNSIPMLTDSCVPSDVLTMPFPHLVIPNALPEPFYQLLQEQFPASPKALSPNERVNLPANSKSVFDVSLSPIWRDFVRIHSSIQFLNSVRHLFSKTRAAPWLSPLGRFLLPVERRWGLNPDDLEHPSRSVESDGFFGFQIALHAGSHEIVVPIGTHFDSRDKLFSCLFYLRSPLDTSLGGDLEIHERLRKTNSKRVASGDSRPYAKIPYAANTAVLFPDSPNALHAVSERLPTNEPRRFCFISAHLPKYDHEKTALQNAVRISADRLKRRLLAREIGKEPSII